MLVIDLTFPEVHALISCEIPEHIREKLINKLTQAEFYDSSERCDLLAEANSIIANYAANVIELQMRSPGNQLPEYFMIIAKCSERLWNDSTTKNYIHNHIPASHLILVPNSDILNDILNLEDNNLIESRGFFNE